METNMRGLDQATGSIGEKLAVINEKATNITGIVTTITKVADQTNLLSVNAAIEAEKAGEYGVGFLVVAREIRRLADQTANATLDIEQMVQQMQSAVSAGVMEMDRFTDQVRRAVKDVGLISQQMAQIIERVNTNTASFERVNESMQSQSQGADQMSEAMGQLTTSARQTTESLKEYSQRGGGSAGSHRRTQVVDRFVPAQVVGCADARGCLDRCRPALRGSHRPDCRGRAAGRGATRGPEPHLGPGTHGFPWPPDSAAGYGGVCWAVQCAKPVCRAGFSSSM